MWWLLLTLACGGGKDDEPDDTGAAPTGEPAPGTQVIAVGASCTDPDTYVVTVGTDFLVSDAVVNVWEVLDGGLGWDEEHPLVAPPEVGDDGDLVSWTLTADRTYDAGFDTVFRCGVHDVSDAMVYVARVYDAETNFADCAAWGGPRVAEVVASPRGGGDVTAFNGVSDPDEIGPDRCTTF